jgi:hypothetical protein
MFYVGYGNDLVQASLKSDQASPSADRVMPVRPRAMPARIGWNLQPPPACRLLVLGNVRAPHSAIRIMRGSFVRVTLARSENAICLRQGILDGRA